MDIKKIIGLMLISMVSCEKDAELVEIPNSVIQNIADTAANAAANAAAQLLNQLHQVYRMQLLVL